MRPRPHRPLAAAVALLAAMTQLAVAGPPAPASRTVVIEAMRYTPAIVDAHPGDTIVWKNSDPFAHTVTGLRGGPDSGEIPAGGTWSYRVTSAGTLSYLCKLHPTMRAAIRVR